MSTGRLPSGASPQAPAPSPPLQGFRSGEAARKLAREIRETVEPGHNYRFMEFCGGHTHVIFRYGLQDLLPDEVEMVHGPGCPVCVLPVGRIDQGIALAERPGVTLASYGDMLRVPGSSRRSLLAVKAAGADVRMVYSAMDALKIAEEEPDREVVFFAIGFETTTPMTAVAIQQAAERELPNFSVFCNHVLTPAACLHIVDGPGAAEREVPIDGFVGPGHVSAVIGSAPYEPFAKGYRKPVVICGFEPLDIMQTVLMLVRQVNDGRAEVEVQYTRVVTREGNPHAKEIMAEVLTPRESFEWRGLGVIPASALRLADHYADFDAEGRFDLPDATISDNLGCRCGEILRGLARPTDCALFGTGCTPDAPVGSCMVSAEGTCAAYYAYGRFREERT